VEIVELKCKIIEMKISLERLSHKFKQREERISDHLGVVAHTCDPSTWEAELGGS
jgi:hypothetical protein